MITKDIWIIRHHTYTIAEIIHYTTVCIYIYIYILFGFSQMKMQKRITKLRDEVTYKITWLLTNRSKYFQYELIVTWLAIRDHVQQNICDEIYEKAHALLKTSQKRFVYIQYYIYVQLFIVTVYMYTKLFLRCFNSDSFL